MLRAALAAYQRAAELEPYRPFHRLALGRLHLALGDPRQAEASVRRAVEIEPNFLPGRAWLARYYLDSGRPGGKELASREYREILARRQRYVTWTKDAYEQQLLTVDTTGLAERLG